MWENLCILIGTGSGLPWALLSPMANAQAQPPTGEPASAAMVFLLFFCIFLMFVMTAKPPATKPEEAPPEPELLEKLLSEVPTEQVSPWGQAGGRLLKAKDGELQAYVSIWKLDERLTKKPPKPQPWWKRWLGL